MWRYIFIYFCSALAFALCGLTINLIQLLLLVTVKQISSVTYKKINYYLCHTYFSLYIFFVDWYSKSELNVYMDKDDFLKYFGKEHSFIISNHSYEIDWILLLSLSDKAGCLGNSKTFIKNVVQFVPGFGMVLYLADYICLARNFEKDKTIIENKIRDIVTYPDPTWIVLYPEGTRFTKSKHEISMKFAREKGLPELKHHLSPRTKGFITSLSPMTGKIGALYDITIAFKESDENKPKIQNLFLGKKIQAYFYIKRIPFEDVPKDEAKAAKFIHDLFVQKDTLRESFYATGDFFTKSGVKRVEKIPISNNYLVLFNAIAWYMFSTGLILYFLINLLLSGQTLIFAVCISLILLFSFFMHKAMSMSKLDNTSKYGVKNHKQN